VLGGAILPLLYFFQNVQGLKQVPALLRIVPLVIAAAVCSPFVGGLVTRRGPRPVILGGLGLIAAGCLGLSFLQPATPYPVVLVALVLIGAGNIAVITPVTEIVLGSVPAERAGSAAALNNAAIQVGGALGAATLTSVFLEAARADYAARLAPTGLSLEKIREITRAWRQAVGESASTGAKVLPDGMERLFEDAFRDAFHRGCRARLRRRSPGRPGVRGARVVRRSPRRKAGGPPRWCSLSHAAVSSRSLGGLERHCPG
jgi:MFS family permease